ncbi:MAG: YopX family protein [Candidatus Ornithomonoglobus sp.]
MRDYLFRGKRKDNGKWIEGYLYRISERLNPSIMLKNRCAESHEVIPETVGRYTGLTDKNGKKIFEGDIVEGNREYFTYNQPYGKVVYDGGQFLIAFDDVLEDIECLGAWANGVEVIGNIHDNPELLEDKQ